MTCSRGTDVALAARILRDGGLVAFATETVYGLGGNALDPAAIARIYEAKQRPAFDPVIAHIPELSWLDQLVRECPPAAQQLADAFWPGPLTLVLPKQPAVPDLLTSGLPNVAVRIPAHPLARELITAAGVPVGAPSANSFGRISPTTAAHVMEQLGDRIDYVLDGGPCSVGLESTVVGFARSPRNAGEMMPVLLRPGGVPLEAIEDVVGPVQRLPSGDGDSSVSVPAETAQLAPGMLPRHYAPETRLQVIDSLEQLPPLRPGERTGLLILRAPGELPEFTLVEELSPTGDLGQAAAGFFAALRRLDAARLDRILAVRLPPGGLGLAMNDRLRRAAQPEN